jgi:hypothetical protein
MPDQKASRTLVKSAPELWAECSEAASLAKHLGAFGDIRITKLEPETAVAWEGEAARGTVRLESSGWGTRVILTARDTPATPSEPDAEPVPEPELVPPATTGPPQQRSGLLVRILLRWRRGSPAAPQEEVEAVEPASPASAPDVPTSEVLDAALDSLGSAHHRPYSRA